MIFMKILGTEKQMMNRRYLHDSVRRYLALLLAVMMLFALPGRLSRSRTYRYEGRDI